MKKTLVTLFLSLFLIVLFPRNTHAELPGKKAYIYEWQIYSMRFLSKLIPNDSSVTEKIVINVSHDEEANASGDAESGRIEITRGMLNEVKTEDEFAFVIAHEYAHIKLKHIPAVIDDEHPLTEELRIKGENEEFEADELAYKIIAGKYDSCAVVRLLTRLSDLWNFLDDPRDPAKIFANKRIETAKSHCHTK